MPNWKKVIISGSDAALNSLNVTSALTASGLIYPTSDGDNGDFLLTDGAGNLSFSRSTVFANVKNVSGGQLLKGTPVHATGTAGNASEVIAASASVASTMPATYILNETLADDAEGLAIITGYINGVNTSAFGEGDVVYVGENGGYTNVKPQGSDNLIQNLGIVNKVDSSNGSGYVYGSGRSNDVPNLPEGKIWVGSPTYSVTSSIVTLDEDNSQVQITGSLDVSNSITGSDILIDDWGSVSASLAAAGGGGGSGTVTSVSGTGTVSGITLTGTVTTSGNLTLGGTLTLTSGQITTGLGFTPYNSTNPAGYTTNTGTVTGTGTTNYISKWTSTTAQGNSLVYDNGTNIGIGTTSPNFKLEVSTNISSPVNEYHVGTGGLSGGAYTAYNIGHGYGSGNVTSKIGFIADTSVPTNYYADAITFNVTAPVISPTTNDSSTEAMRITSAGDVGIGTSTPDEELEVVGNIKLSETAATTDTDKFVVLDSGVLKYRTGTQLLSDIGGGSGTVTSVGGTGTVSGLTLTGTVTTSGNLTLGGTISISSTNITDVDAFSQSGTYASLRAQATTKGDVGLGNVENTALSTYTGNGGALDNQYITNGAGYTTATGTVDTSGVPVTNDFARFTDADTIEGRSYSEVKSDLSLNNVENTALSTYTGNGGALDNQYITNGAGYTTNIGTVTSVGGTGTVSGLTLTGTVTTSGNLTLGGTLTLTSGQITTGLGFTPYNATNPSGYTSFAEPGIFSGGGTPTLASGVTGAEVRTLIGAGTSDVTITNNTNNQILTATGGSSINGESGLLFDGTDLDLTGGDFTIQNAIISNQENTDVDTGTETVAEISSTTYTAAFFDYVIKNGTNLRAGTVFACHDGSSNVEYTETSTNDLGDTSDVALKVDISGGNIRLTATTTSDNWSVKSLVRGL